MPAGKRQSAFSRLFEYVLSEKIQGHVAVFDKVAAEEAAELEAAGQMQGRPRDARDTMIAGIVLANHATLATRNVRPFEDLCKRVVNPWKG